MSTGLGFQWAVAMSLGIALTSLLSSGVVAQESRAPLLHERVWSMPPDSISHPDITERLGAGNSCLSPRCLPPPSRRARSRE
jgi:hypothetical protein